MPIKETIKDLLPPKLRDQLRVHAYRAETVVRRPLFTEIDAPKGGWQILLGISLPKSGTHLLHKILLSFSEFAPFSHHIPLHFDCYDETTGAKHSVDEALVYLDSLRPLDVTAARLLAWDAVVKRVASPAFLPIFLYRDPRDVALSQAFSISDMLSVHQRGRYAEKVHSLDERLTASILGYPLPTTNLVKEPAEFQNIAERFSDYTAWLEAPQVLSISFEDFSENKRATLGKIFDHVAKAIPNLPVERKKAIDILEKSIASDNSLNLQGEWKKYFNDEHKATFKEVTGDLLIKLGYEDDGNW